MDLILKVYDDYSNVIWEQVFFNTPEETVDAQGRKMVEFFKADRYETFDWN